MIYSLTNEMLLRIEAELAGQDLLSTQPPSAQAMASVAPFACDVMPFEHWLQFIFLPKMHALVDQALSLPTAISIAPMAQHVWGSNLELHGLINILNELDELLSESK